MAPSIDPEAHPLEVPPAAVTIPALSFIIECEKLKAVERRSRPIGMPRRENSAEHSWTLALMAMTLGPEINPAMDMLRVIKMLLLHDIVEIDAGDTFCYADQSGKAEREQAAADRIFGLLPAERAAEFMELWHEFEEAATPEAKFANALDRVMPLIQNHANGGGTWSEHGITTEQVLGRAGVIEGVSAELWQHVKSLVAAAQLAGWLKS
ncbi:HD domain-containing protein [Luteolibacter sp. GHJ8]|uniref:5'-deoxynucleotidase n=1 Tax=Luteolibacter rhizosphaerae TaxID=2989719 RepID=A0ABT3G5W4_9BACT|nr:HD domain-containing protein [Luteolibacter rhizosphaerae]MCW1915217.1 HD domain-containing protein [Luteolibacter rhizosphaerae]